MKFRKKEEQKESKIYIAHFCMSIFQGNNNYNVALKRTLKKFPQSRPEQVKNLMGFYYPDINIEESKSIENRISNKVEKHEIIIKENVTFNGFIPPFLKLKK